ncbi:MAG: septum formation initiator family protein [Oscillospiraceae bacterium]|nr:septum formation initiator family protein [Oscillospiraceae bacterium]
MARNNLAYDLNRYSTAGKAHEPELIRDIKKDPVRKKSVNLFAAVTVMAAILALTFAMIYTHVRLSEVGGDIVRANTELAKVENEHKLLRMELESAKSISEIEEYAKNELGMIKQDRSRIESFYGPKEDNFEIVERQPRSFWQKLQGMINDFFRWF